MRLWMIVAVTVMAAVNAPPFLSPRLEPGLSGEKRRLGSHPARRNHRQRQFER
jgi:hypothetical protein